MDDADEREATSPALGHADDVTPTLVLTDVPRADFDTDGVLDEDDETPFGE